MASARGITIIEASDWMSSPERFAGEWQGQESGSRISLIANQFERVGQGAKLHRHPYAEVFLVRRGNVAFEVGGETLIARAGQIIVAPANIPHAFSNAGPGPLEMIDLHEAGSFETEWL